LGKAPGNPTPFENLKRDILVSRLLFTTAPCTASAEVVDGRNREVRVVSKAAGVDVKKLKRVRVGGLRMPSELPIGKYMSLKPHQVGLHKLNPDGGFLYRIASHHDSPLLWVRGACVLCERFCVRWASTLSSTRRTHGRGVVRAAFCVRYRLRKRFGQPPGAYKVKTRF
jgi:hypothetical protein